MKPSEDPTSQPLNLSTFQPFNLSQEPPPLLSGNGWLFSLCAFRPQIQFPCSDTHADTDTYSYSDLHNDSDGHTHSDMSIIGPRALRNSALPSQPLSNCRPAARHTNSRRISAPGRQWPTHRCRSAMAGLSTDFGRAHLARCHHLP